MNTANVYSLILVVVSYFIKNKYFNTSNYGAVKCTILITIAVSCGPDETKSTIWVTYYCIGLSINI